MHAVNMLQEISLIIDAYCKSLMKSSIKPFKMKTCIDNLVNVDQWCRLSLL